MRYSFTVVDRRSGTPNQNDIAYQSGPIWLSLDVDACRIRIDFYNMVSMLVLRDPFFDEVCTMLDIEDSDIKDSKDPLTYYVHYYQQPNLLFKYLTYEIVFTCS